MASQLDLYNDALLLCGERFLLNVTENVEARRLLDHAWSFGSGAVTACLEMGQWNFAMRSDKLGYDTSIAPTWGLRRAYQKPSDWVLTCGVCSDEFFNVPLTKYKDEAGIIYADIDIIFVRYISNASTYGGNLGAWPQSFSEYVSSYLASKVILKLSNSDDEEKKILAIMKDRLLTAKNKSAMAEGTQFMAQGTWSRSRQRFGGGRQDLGNNNSLIG